MLTEEDKIALAALVTRYTRLYDENQVDLKLKEELDARMSGRRQDFQKLHSAFSIFGFDTAAGGTGGFAKIKEAVGEDGYYDALRKAGRVVVGKATPKDEASSEDNKAPLEDETGAPTVREMVIDQLRAAGSKGTKAGDIRTHIEGVRATTLHAKTIGMTLYRLSQDGLARREKRTWFFIPPEAERKNPGGETPGLFPRTAER